jgi:hypothetical protein
MKLHLYYRLRRGPLGASFEETAAQCTCNAYHCDAHTARTLPTNGAREGASSMVKRWLGGLAHHLTDRQLTHRQIHTPQARVATDPPGCAFASDKSLKVSSGLPIKPVAAIDSAHTVYYNGW